MKVTDKFCTIELTSDEAYEIAWKMGAALKQSCKDHYKNFDRFVFDDATKETQKLMKQFFEISLYPHVYESVISECEKILKEGKNE